MGLFNKKKKQDENINTEDNILDDEIDEIEINDDIDDNVKDDEDEPDENTSTQTDAKYKNLDSFDYDNIEDNPENTNSEEDEEEDDDDDEENEDTDEYNDDEYDEDEDDEDDLYSGKRGFDFSDLLYMDDTKKKILIGVVIVLILAVIGLKIATRPKETPPQPVVEEVQNPGHIEPGGEANVNEITEDDREITLIEEDENPVRDDAHVNNREHYININYELDGGINNSENLERVNATSIEDVYLYEPTKENYTFEGWYSDSDYENEITSLESYKYDENFNTLTDINLYAKWEKIEEEPTPSPATPTPQKTTNKSNTTSNTPKVQTVQKEVLIEYPLTSLKTIDYTKTMNIGDSFKIEDYLIVSPTQYTSNLSYYCSSKCITLSDGLAMATKEGNCSITVRSDNGLCTQLNITVKCNHKWKEIQNVSSTCSTTGYQKYECILCGKVEKDEINQKGHKFTKPKIVLQPSCDTEGQEVFICADCDAESDPISIPALGHDYIEKVTKKATCTSKGTKTYTCKNCGDTYSESIMETGHDYKITNTVPSTKTAYGSQTYTCTGCGKTYTNRLPKQN